MAYPTSDLGFENVLRDVHDPVTQSLRTTANATIVIPGGLEVKIEHQNDSVRLGDGVNFLTSTYDGGKVALDVAVLGGIRSNSYPLEKGLTVNSYNEITAVASGVDALVTTYTVPPGKAAYLSRIEYSGTNIAIYTVNINSQPQDKKRTNYAVSLNDSTIFNSNGNTGIPLVAGDEVDLVVRHVNNSAGDFNARIEVIEVDV